ncbi:MAG TPA: efflux RND transporter permease subunit, partial [Patescibacteria group bacterium]|nr:efflux RND transporter permease subunit [Patescibacteria group bacterium]
MTRLTELSLAKRSVTLLLAAGLFFAGISAWGSLKQELLPDIDFPVITVIAPLPGAGAADVAEQVARPIERTLSTVPRLANLSSSSANSIAIVVAQFEFGTDIREARSTIEQNLQGAGLPAGVSPRVSALNINASPVIIGSVAGTSAEGLDAAALVARTEVVPALLGIEGVATVDLTGGLEPQVVVTLDPARLTETGISAAQVSGILAANNLTVPSGQVTADGMNIPVSTIGAITSITQIRDLVVGFRLPVGMPGPGAGMAPGGQSAQPAAPTPVLLREIATIAEVGVPTTGFARTDGVPSLTLTVTKTSDANTVEVADAVTRTLEEIGAAHADTVSVTVISDLSVFIKESRDGLLKEGGLGALFAILTIFLFLFSIRSTLVAAVSIPLSVLTALVVMQATGITINVMTLGGLAVAVGRVVDDAIVVLENIYRHRALGEDRLTAALRGPREVAAAITSATLTTVAVFLPLGLVGGIVSELFLPFALTVTFALLASLVVALTVVPVLAYLVIGRVKLNVDEDGEPKNSFWIRAYTPTINLALRSRATKWGVLVASTALFIASIVIAPLLPTQFINAGSEKLLQVTIAPPSGTSSAAVLDRAIAAETILLADPQVEHVQASVPGEGDTSFGTITAALSGRPANSATLTVRLSDEVELTTYAQKLSADLAPIKTDGYDVAVAQTAGFTSNALSIVVSSENPADVATATDELMAALSDNADLLNLKSDLSKGTLEVQAVVDPNQAIGAGLTAAQVAGEIRTALVGQVATTVQLDARAGPRAVFVRVDPAQITSVEALRELPVGTAATVPLGTIAAVEQVLAQGSITRVDQAPASTVSAEIGSDDTGAVSIAVQAEIETLGAAGKIPDGVTVELAGVTQQQNEAFGNLFVAMGVAILLVYVMMVLTFNSLITPFIILFSLPLATIGAFPALLLTGRPIGVSALIGFLMLIGIVVTNAIVLLDLVERLRREGRSVKDALIEGGRTRVRPILMTAIATILALIPLAAGLSEGSIIAAELGTVVIGGLFSSTFLTLLVIPVLYSLVEGGKVGLAGRLGRSDGQESAANALVPEQVIRASAEAGPAGGGPQSGPVPPGSL